MRKQSIIVRCDGNGCKEVGEVSDLRETPVGWYHVKRADSNLRLDPNVGFDLCGLRCVEKWAKARRVIVEERKQAVGLPAATDPRRNGDDPDKDPEPSPTPGRGGNVKALIQAADALREEIFELLSDKPLTSRQIQELTGKQQSTVDKHLRILQGEGLAVKHGGGNKYSVGEWTLAT